MRSNVGFGSWLVLVGVKVCFEVDGSQAKTKTKIRLYVAKSVVSALYIQLLYGEMKGE